MATFEKRVLNGNINYRVKVRHKGYPAQTKTFKRLADAHTNPTFERDLLPAQTRPRCAAELASVNPVQTLD